jgi:hypothetical protein
LAHQACDDVGRAAGREADDQPHIPRRVGLRQSGPRSGGERSRARSSCRNRRRGILMATSPQTLPTLACDAHVVAAKFMVLGLSVAAGPRQRTHYFRMRPVILRAACVEAAALFRMAKLHPH